MGGGNMGGWNERGGNMDGEIKKCTLYTVQQLGRIYLRYEVSNTKWILTLFRTLKDIVFVNPKSYAVTAAKQKD